MVGVLVSPLLAACMLEFSPVDEILLFVVLMTV